MKTVITVNVDNDILGAMRMSGITNRSEYISGLLARELGLVEGKAETLGDVSARLKEVEALHEKMASWLRTKPWEKGA